MYPKQNDFAQNGGNLMIQNYLKAGYPALCVLTQEPHRAEQLLICDGWKTVCWDCIQGIREAGNRKIIEEIKDPVEAINWLGLYKDTVLIMNSLHIRIQPLKPVLWKESVHIKSRKTCDFIFIYVINSKFFNVVINC